MAATTRRHSIVLRRYIDFDREARAPVGMNVCDHKDCDREPYIVLEYDGAPEYATCYGHRDHFIRQLEKRRQADL
jgi:hypothetical protein